MTGRLPGLDDCRMKLAFVGCGKHAKVLRDAFVGIGCRVVAHSRGEIGFPEPGFGELLPIEMFEDVGLVIAAAPPEATSRAACAFAVAGRAVLATKPLSWHPAVTSAPFMVDFWRLRCPAYLALRMLVRDRLGYGIRPERIEIEFSGSGPFRDFSGLLDYGPHALAYYYDLFGALFTDWRACYEPMDGGVGITLQLEGRSVFVSRRANRSVVPTRLVFGNGSREPRKVIRVQYADGGELVLLEQDGTFLFCPPGGSPIEIERPVALREYAKHAVRCVESGVQDSSLRYSRSSMADLTDFRAAADGAACTGRTRSTTTAGSAASG